MPRFIRANLLLISACLLFSSALAQPQPRFVAGKMEEGNLVRIFGQGFGEAPIKSEARALAAEDPIPSGTLLVGDRPSLETCSLRRVLLWDSWSDQEISFNFVEEQLPSPQHFYLYIIDDQGEVGAAIGPWSLGLGTIAGSGERIPLVEKEQALVPQGEWPGAPPGPDLGPPGPPTQVQLIPESD
jgi:hypothetical protein